jgi:cell wall-associated NlpC family hydrolase
MTFGVPHISERLAQVQTRIAELQALQSLAGAVAGADRGFAGVLSDAVRDVAAPSVASGVSDPATAAHEPVEGTSPAGPAATGRRAVAIARQQLGTPYVRGPSTRPTGSTAPGWCSTRSAGSGLISRA